MRLYNLDSTNLIAMKTQIPEPFLIHSYVLFIQAQIESNKNICWTKGSCYIRTKSPGIYCILSLTRRVWKLFAARSQKLGSFAHALPMTTDTRRNTKLLDWFIGQMQQYVASR